MSNKSLACNHCGASSVKLSKCAGCREKQYCGKPCQVADWKAGHKRSCTSKKEDGRKEQLSANEISNLNFMSHEQADSDFASNQTFPAKANVVDPNWNGSDANTDGGFCAMVIKSDQQILRMPMLSKGPPIGSMKALVYVPLAVGENSFTIKAKLSVLLNDEKISSHLCWLTINPSTMNVLNGMPIRSPEVTLPTDCYWEYLNTLRDEVEKSGGTMVKSEDPSGKVWIAVARSECNYNDTTSVKIEWDFGPGLVSVTSHNELLIQVPMESEDPDGNTLWTRKVLVEENENTSKVGSSKTLAHATMTMFAVNNLCVHFQKSMGRIGFKKPLNVQMASM